MWRPLLLAAAAYVVSAVLNYHFQGSIYYLSVWVIDRTLAPFGLDYPAPALALGLAIEGFFLSLPLFLLCTLGSWYWARSVLAAQPTHRCPTCGYDLRDSSDSCPECGRPITGAKETRGA